MKDGGVLLNATTPTPRPTELKPDHIWCLSYQGKLIAQSITLLLRLPLVVIRAKSPSL
jgi:hypothetical protein